ncbi:MAG: TonB-dependent receptor [Candidatus Symbiothrix sp.]|jgi:TonB-linked SusC/RagA family outer membrane protein|nr:TonB-dependent receptor [Candidatus Symbiothrix sp.]
MRKLLFLAGMIFLIVVPESHAQPATLSLNLKNKTIREVFNEIESHSDFTFFYYDNVLDVKRKVSINVANQSIETILEQLFAGTDNTWAISDRQIVISKKESKTPKLSVTQERRVSGQVLDDKGDPMIGATVQIAGTNRGVVTDIDGHYSLTVPDGNVRLQFIYLGYAKQEEAVGNRQIVNIRMKEEADELDELVVVGYGTMRKRDLTGSVASVKGDLLNTTSNVNVQTALQGRLPGVYVKQSSGMPGSTMQIRIRGTNSIKGGNEPLYIIDGFPSSIAALNVADVESIEILKDASASAIYGSRAANGVVLVTTKQAKQGKMQVEYNGSLGYAKQIKKLDLMSASEYLQFMNEQQKIATGNDYYTPDQIADAGKGTDWQDLVFRTAQVQNHSLNITGGNDMMQALLGFSYYDQEGIIAGNEIKKMSMRANLMMNLSKNLKILGNLLYNFSDWDRNDSSGTNRLSSVIGSVLGAPATIKPYNDDGSYSLMTTDFLIGGLNPIAYINEVSSIEYNYRVLSNVTLEYKPIPELTLRLSGNATTTNTRSEYYRTTLFPGSQGSASLSFPQTVDLNSANTLTYDKTFNKSHHLTAMGGLTYDESVSKSASMSAETFQSDAGGVFNIGAGAKQNVPSSRYSKWTMLSFLGRLNYSYQSKYLATLNMRADGSSRYSKGGKWGYFPSGAVAWRMSEESFMKNLPFLSNWKWRVGYGITGNTGISPYQTLDLISTGTIVLNKDLVTYYRMSDTYQSDLKWETTRHLDLGADISLFNNRLNITADYYQKKTDNLLNTVEMPRSSGFTTSTQNIGKMENEGFELAINGDIIQTKDWQWNLAANASFNRNKVTELYKGADMYGATQDIVIMKDIIHLIRVGEPLGVFYGYVEDGYDDYGNVQYKDVDPDGKITALDRQIIGDPHPDCTLGLTSSLRWKDLQLSCFWYASIGNDIYSLSMAALTHDYQWGISTMREVLYDHWTPENTNAKYPNITAAASGNLRMSDRFVYDGSYLRMKNIELAYSLPLQRWGLKNSQIYVSGQNLLTITNYPFWDPEVNAGAGSNVEQGLDAYNYPGNKSITVGMRLVF